MGRPQKGRLFPRWKLENLSKLSAVKRAELLKRLNVALGVNLKKGAYCGALRADGVLRTHLKLKRTALVVDRDKGTLRSNRKIVRASSLFYALIVKLAPWQHSAGIEFPIAPGFELCTSLRYPFIAQRGDMLTQAVGHSVCP